MKKWLSLVLALVLSLSLASSFAEETGESAGAFEAALQEWAKDIDLSKADYRLSWESEGQSASAVVRGDKTLTLIEIPDFGKIQLSKDKLVLQLKDGTTVIDLSSLMTFRQSPDNLTMDAQMLTLLMMQAVQQVIMPSVEMTQNENGTVFHLSVDNQVLVRRLFDFLDKTFENKSYRSLIARYSATLKSAIPDFPQTEEELLSWWKKVYPNAEKVKKTATLEMDVVSSASSGKTETVAFGTLVSTDSTRDFSFELVNGEDGITLKAHALETVNSRTLSSCTVNLAKRGDDLSIHSASDSVRSGSASLDLEIEGSEISGNIKEHGREYTVAGSRNVSANSADIRIRRVGSEQPEGADIAVAPGQLYIRSLQNDRSVRCSVSSASTYTHLSLLGEDSLSGRDYSCDFWAVKTPTGGQLLRYRQAGAAGWNPYTAVNMWFRSEQDFSEGEVETSVYGTTSSASFRFTPGENGFSLEARESRRIHNEESDSALVLEKSGNNYTYDADVSKAGKHAKITGDLVVDDNRKFVSAAGTVSEENRLTGEMQQTTRYEFTPRKSVVEDAEGTRTLEVVQDTAEEVIWEARKNDKPTSTFTAALSETEAGTAFNCTGTKDGENVFAFSVTPLAKEEVVPIDETGAFVISAETLPVILEQLFKVN